MSLLQEILEKIGMSKSADRDKRIDRISRMRNQSVEASERTLDSIDRARCSERTLQEVADLIAGGRHVKH